MPAAFQQPRGSPHDGENVAVLPNQLHLRLLRAVQQFVEFGHIRHIAFQFKIVILPEMDIQLTVPNIDFPLFKALAPAVAVLTGNICAEHGLFLGGQWRVRIDPQGADQFTVYLVHVRNGADDLAADGIILAVISHQIAVKVFDILVDGIADNIAVAGQFFAGVRDTLVFAVVIVQILGVIWEKVRSQRRIKFHLQIMSPLSAAQVVVDLCGIVVFYRQRRIVERRQ